MAAYDQVDDDALIHACDGPGSMLRSRYRPVSVAGIITEAGEILPLEDSIRHRLQNKLNVSPRIMADLAAARSQFVKKRPRSANVYEWSAEGSIPVTTEPPFVEVIDEVVKPVVKPLRSTPEQPKLHGVSSRGAWEGRSRLHRSDSSQSRWRRYRRRSSSSPSSSESSDGGHSSLATPLHQGLDQARESDRGSRYRTPPRFQRTSRETSEERSRERARHSEQPSERHSSVSHDTRPKSVTGPPMGRDEQLSSDDADESGTAGELSGEVRDILTSQAPTRRSALQGGRPNGTTGCRSDPGTGRRGKSELLDSHEVVPSVSPAVWKAESRGRGGSRTGRRSVEQTGHSTGPEPTCYQRGLAARIRETVHPVASAEWDSESRGRGGSRTGRRSVEQTGHNTGPEPTRYQQGLAARAKEEYRRSCDRISPAELSSGPELPRFSDRPVSKWNERQASRGVNYKDAVDDWPSYCRSRPNGNYRDRGDRGDYGKRNDRRDRGEHWQYGDPCDNSHAGAAPRDGAGSGSSKRRGSDDEGSSAFHPVAGGNGLPVVRPSATIGVANTPEIADLASTLQKACGGVKLEIYEGTTCLETFLASVKNFSSYYKWTERDELFHLKASLRGPAGQLLWDLGPDVTLEELIRLLKQRFGSTDQVERFRTELRNRRRRPGEDLQSLYNDVRRLMSLAYPVPNTSVLDVVGRDAFLDALGDPELRVRVLDKVPTSMDEALRIALNLEALDKSRENYKKTLEPQEELSEDEPRRRKEKSSRLAVKSVETNSNQTELVQSQPALAKMDKLEEALTSCMQEMSKMRKEFGTKNQSAQSNAKAQQPNQSSHNQPVPGNMNPGSFRPRAPNGQATNGNRSMGPRQSNFVPRQPGSCHYCGRVGHYAKQCRDNPANSTTTSAQQPNSTPDNGSSEVRLAMNLKELRDVYVPVQIFNHKTSALLDTGCDSSIIGARLLPPGVHVEPTLHTLRAANGTAIPVEGVAKVTLRIGTQEFTIHAVVTRAVHEMILGIDFLTDADADWRFREGKIKLGKEWIQLRQRDTSDDVRKVYVCDNCVVPPGVQAEVPVEIS